MKQTQPFLSFQKCLVGIYSFIRSGTDSILKWSRNERTSTNTFSPSCHFVQFYSSTRLTRIIIMLPIRFYYHMKRDIVNICCGEWHKLTWTFNKKKNTNRTNYFACWILSLSSSSIDPIEIAFSLIFLTVHHCIVVFVFSLSVSLCFFFHY